jgi:hypothetical protein
MSDDERQLKAAVRGLQVVKSSTCHTPVTCDSSFPETAKTVLKVLNQAPSVDLLPLVGSTMNVAF